MAGRPRNREVDEALRAAALEIFLEGGFAALTLEGVAGRAGVSRASLYRRWTRREDLLADALRAHRVAFDGFGAGWDIRLASLLTLFADRVRTVFADQRLRRLIMQLLSLGPEASAIRDEYFAAVVAPRRVAFARAIAAAAAAGEIASDVDPWLVQDAIAGALAYQLVSGGAEAADFDGGAYALRLFRLTGLMPPGESPSGRREETAE